MLKAENSLNHWASVLMPRPTETSKSEHTHCTSVVICKFYVFFVDETMFCRALVVHMRLDLMQMKESLFCSHCEFYFFRRFTTPKYVGKSFGKDLFQKDANLQTGLMNPCSKTMDVHTDKQRGQYQSHCASQQLFAFSKS